MNFQMNLQEDDFNKFNNEHIKRSLYKRKFYLLIPFAIIIVPLFSNRNRMNILSSILAPLVFISIFMIVFWLVLKYTSKSGRYKDLVGDWNIIISESNIYVKSPQATSTINWMKTMSVVDGKYGIYLYTQPTIGLVIPNRYIKDKSMRIDMISSIEGAINAA